MRDILTAFVSTFLKMVLPVVYAAWFLRLGIDNFDAAEGLIYIPVYLLSLIGIWQATLFICSLLERLIDKLMPEAETD